MRTDKQATPLLHALRCCTVPEQHEMAKLAGTSRGYLYQLAAGDRTAGGRLASALVKASREMHIKTTGRIPKLTLEEIVSPT
jgi:hypothetical protein